MSEEQNYNRVGFSLCCEWQSVSNLSTFIASGASIIDIPVSFKFHCSFISRGAVAILNDIQKRRIYGISATNYNISYDKNGCIMRSAAKNSDKLHGL